MPTPDDEEDLFQEAIDLTTAEGYMLAAGQDPDEARRQWQSQQAGPLAQRIEPQVVSRAKPSADWLKDARALLNRNESLRSYVRQARADGLDAASAVDGLSIRLNELWGGQRAQEAYEVAQYLWDEQSQLGEGYYITSTETGKVVASLSERDIYQPAPVPREGGGMAVPLPRIRPDIEAALTCWAFDAGREAQMLQKLAERAHQTALLREEGDPRMLVATRAGRHHIVDQFSKFDPRILLRAAGGTSGAFLSMFELRTHDPEDTTGLHLVEGTVYSKTVMGVQDMTTVNLHHNRAASLQGALVQGWVREVARHLSRAASNNVNEPEEIRQLDLKKDHFGGSNVWVSPPEAVRYLRRAEPNLSVLPVPSADLMGLLPSAGVLVVPREFAASSHEMFDRWEAHSTLTFRLWVDWSKVRLLRLSGVEHQAVPV